MRMRDGDVVLTAREAERLELGDPRMMAMVEAIVRDYHGATDPGGFPTWVARNPGGRLGRVVRGRYTTHAAPVI